MTSEEEPSRETASLVKRLAGPSTGKAGLAKDQTEINRIIAEASKGSKFYENEKKKDKELTERISRILKQRDDILMGVDIEKVEIGVDHLLVDLEAQRDLSQVVVHVDMDAFYANVELLFDPTLEGKPFGVGRGILTTASYEARKYGVRSGMPAFIAKKLCPEITFVPNHFSRYIEMSGKVMEIFRRFDPNMCAAGIDEGYLNITEYCEEQKLAPDECVQQMRNKVMEETKLTVSAGIAPNKMLAKICSDKNKPNGQFCIPFTRQSILSFMHDLSIRKIPGIGRVNERLLESIGIKTCGDIFTNRATLSLMDKQFGLKFLLQTYLGIASNVVQPGRREERKSIGYERTFAPINDKGKILSKLEECAVELAADMNETGWTGKTVTVKFKLDTYQVFTRAKSFDRWITTKDDLWNTGKELLQHEWPLKIRLIGLRVTKLKDLKASVEPSGGIKRFFEPSNASPNKKRRLSDDVEPLESTSGVQDSINPPQVHAQDSYDDAMPGFHEHDEHDMDPDVDDEDEDSPAAHNLIYGVSRKPLSVNIAAKGMDSRTLQAPNPNDNINRTIGLSEPPSQTCPICSKILDVDNQGLNAHVDFCLSRTAIRDAHAESTSPVKTDQRTRRLESRNIRGDWKGFGRPPSSGKTK